MKKLFLAFAYSLVAATVLGQGTVQFNNRISGLIDARLVLANGSGAGAGWTAQLYGGPVGGTLRALTPTTTFRTTSAAAMGYLNPVDVSVPGVAAGGRATLVMKAFDGASFESSLIRYESNPVEVALGGGNLPPAALVGLRSFILVSQTSPPSITLQPQGQTLVPSSTVTFRVEASGTAPLRFQWRKDGMAIAGATGTTLVLGNVSAANAGIYSVEVSNAAGSVISLDAPLTSPANVDTGVVLLNNRVTGAVDVKVVLRDGTAVSTGWTAQLYGGPEGGTLVPLLPTTTFRTDAGAGYVNPINVNVTGVKPGARATLQVKVYNGVSFENSPRRLESNPFTLVVGGGTLPPPNLIGLTRFTEVGILAPPFVQRVLPAGYSPGGPVVVTLKTTPPSGSSVHALEDRPPSRWTVAKVSDEGKFDPNTGKVKFGPFFDANARTLSYEATPPAGESGVKEFVGSASADGSSSAIAGDATLDIARHHPADNNPSDFRVSIDETTAYGSAWRKGRTWPVGPNPVPIDYVTRAGTLWKNGETYTLDARIAGPPLWWINAPAAAGGAARQLVKNSPPLASSSTIVAVQPTLFVPTETITIQLVVKPVTGVSVYAAEDQIPEGWAVKAISHGGEFDPVNNRVKWGPFFDADPRDLSYEVVSPAHTKRTVHFEGTASFDGTGGATGPRQARATARLGKLQRSASGEIQLGASGLASSDIVIEVSTDLHNWAPVPTVTNPDGTLKLQDAQSAASALRFYRAVVK